MGPGKLSFEEVLETFNSGVGATPFRVAPKKNSGTKELSFFGFAPLYWNAARNPTRERRNMIDSLAWIERRSRTTLVCAGLAMLALIGLVDYLTGFEILFSVFYLLEVGLAAWFVGRGFGLLMSFLSANVWIGGDTQGGRPLFRVRSSRFGTH